MPEIHIGFDVSQKPRGRLDTNYTTLKQILESEGVFACWEYSSFPITRESLQNYDILVFPCTDFSKFTANEILEISKWVNEDGGGLLLLSHAGGDRGRRTNMSELASQFAMLFENDQVLDEFHNFGIDNMPEIKSFPTPHPISEGIGNICYRAGCSVSLVGIAEQVALANMDANPQMATVIGASEPGSGRVVCIGSYEIFRDEIIGGINQPYHSQLAMNVFSWLITDKRRQLRETGYGSQPAGSSGTGIHDGIETSSNGAVDGDFTDQLVSISSIHDLFIEIKNIKHDADLLRARIENIFSVVAALDSTGGGGGGGGTGGMGDLVSTGAPPAAGVVPASLPQPDPVEPDGPTSQEDLLSLIKATKGADSGGGGSGGGGSGSSEPPAGPSKSSSSGASIGDLLSELKEEQKSGRSVDLDSLKISQPGLGKVAPDIDIHEKKSKEEKIEYKLSASDKRKSKEQLDDEVEKLEAKIKSLVNLKDFKSRQFEDGKIDEEKYQKEIAKFEKDITMTNSRIMKYKKLMDSK
ncbi:MAG: hypothetical protein ACTSUE_24855 [Promethearchaeota archaeon]